MLTDKKKITYSIHGDFLGRNGEFYACIEKILVSNWTKLYFLCATTICSQIFTHSDIHVSCKSFSLIVINHCHYFTYFLLVLKEPLKYVFLEWFFVYNLYYITSKLTDHCKVNILIFLLISNVSTVGKKISSKNNKKKLSDFNLFFLCHFSEVRG